MADIALRYQTIMDVHDHLHAGHESTVSALNDMQTKVDNLDQRDGGLGMNQTSPAIQGAYDNFSQSALQVVTSIGSFSDMFKQLVAGMASMDEKMAYQIQHPPPSTTGASQKEMPPLNPP